MAEAERGGTAPPPPERRFRGDARRKEVNPYVERIRDFAPYTMEAEEAEGNAGRWRELCGAGAGAPLLLEIGPGNGFFFRELCRRQAGALVLGVELRWKRVWLTAKKARDAGLANFRVLHHHAAWLPELFGAAEIDAVYVHHPDPWPRDRQHKHRLLQPRFEATLRRLLRPGGELWLKTDYAPYGPLARELFAPPAWEELAFTEDLHGSGAALREAPPPPLPGRPAARFWAADARTNYERKSLEKGLRITLLGLRLRDPPASPASPAAAAAR